MISVPGGMKKLGLCVCATCYSAVCPLCMHDPVHSIAVCRFSLFYFLLILLSLLYPVEFLYILPAVCPLALKTLHVTSNFLS